jgi:hypothetical protein
MKFGGIAPELSPLQALSLPSSLDGRLRGGHEKFAVAPPEVMQLWRVHTSSLAADANAGVLYGRHNMRGSWRNASIR